MRAYKKAGRPPCALDGCPRPKYCKGLCVMHYDRLRRRGDVGTVESERRARGTGHVTDYGYLWTSIPGHPLATAQNKVAVHRVVLYERIGPGRHPCHWCGKSLPWMGGADVAINVDHLDHNRLNNDPDNLVPSCLDCNTKRRPEDAQVQRA